MANNVSSVGLCVCVCRKRPFRPKFQCARWVFWCNLFLFLFKLFLLDCGVVQRKNVFKIYFALLFFLLGFCLFFFSFVVDRYQSTLTSSQDTDRFLCRFLFVGRRCCFCPQILTRRVDLFDSFRFGYHFTFPPWHHFTVGAVKLPEDAHNLPLTPFHPNHVQNKIPNKRKWKKNNLRRQAISFLFKWMDATTAINKRTAQKLADGLVGWTGNK